jgi:3D (Asp-Asp-Asp) domain-containing protein
MTLSTLKTPVFSFHTVINAVAILAFAAQVLNPYMALADTVNASTDPLTIPTTLVESEEGALFGPVEPASQPDMVMIAEISAYTSTPGQTDDTPFIAANGKHVHDGMIAANGLPFGTIVKIPSLYGDKEFIVEDRMNKRYKLGNMDIWLDTSRKEALKFGRKHLKVEIYLPSSQIAKK